MLKTAVISLALVVAQSASAQVPRPTESTLSSHAHATQNHQLIKPGDRLCIRNTGSLIPAKKGKCLEGVAGRSYTQQELQNTGAINNAQALRMLDPSIH